MRFTGSTDVVRMLDWGDPVVRTVLFILVLWATTGLTLIHIVVIAGRFVSRPFRKRVAPQAPLPSGRRPTLTFIVPVHNDSMTVGSTIDSILRQRLPADRVLVVDDGSTDDTAAVVDRYRAKGVHVVHMPQNVGKSRALEAALRMVHTDLVAITDADSVVHPDYTTHIQTSFRDAEVVAVGGAVESLPHTWVTASRQLEYMLTVQIDRDAETTMNAIVVLPGVSTTYRTDVLREMGFEFDTIAEDFDLTFRLQRANRKIVMNLDAKVYTSDPPTLRTYHRQLLRWYTDFWLVLRKHRQVLGKRVFGTVEVPMLILNATISSALYLVLPVFLLFVRPAELINFLAIGLLFDLILVIIAWRVYKRTDVWWALLSRAPTRFIGRAAYLTAMFRVLIGRPGLAWEKLERRRIERFVSRATTATAGRGALSESDRVLRAAADDEFRKFLGRHSR